MPRTFRNGTSPRLVGLSALAAVAVGPSLALIHCLWSRERYREPPGNIARNLLVGGLVMILAAVLESGLEHPILRGEGAGRDVWRTPAWAFLVVALVEEIAKYCALRWRSRRDQHLDESFDWALRLDR